MAVSPDCPDQERYCLIEDRVGRPSLRIFRRRSNDGVPAVWNLSDVIEHYNTFFNLKLSEAEKTDMVEYLKSL